MNSCRLSIFLIAAFFSQASFAFAKDDHGARHKSKQLVSQLEAARDSLHEAHRELAKKAERNQELQRQLELLQKRQKDPGDAASKKMREEIAALRKKNGELARALAAAKRELAGQEKTSEKVVRKEKAKKDAPKRPRSITIRYEENSAANLEGREKALKWIEGRMKEGVKKFSIEGFANDSKYPEACEVIAGNRAKYLADYLALNGIPSDSLSVSAAVADSKGEKGRFVSVTAIGN